MTPASVAATRRRDAKQASEESRSVDPFDGIK